MNDRFGKDLTVGSIPKQLIFFSLPLFLGNLLYSGYSIINMIWVGKIIGENAIGATTVSLPIILILSSVIGGATTATSILVSQYYGAKDYGMLEKLINTSFLLSLFMGLVVTISGAAYSDLLLKIMNTPSTIFAMASTYLRISLVGVLFMYMYFFVAAVLRGIGDSLTTLVILIISTLFNAAFDPILIIGIGPFPRLGLNGAAIASLIAQISALLFAFIHMIRKKIFKFNLRELKIDKSMVLLTFKIGFPSIVQQCLVQIGAIFVTSFVNMFGAAATAAFGAASRIDSLATMPAAAVNTSVSSLTGQNLGAGKIERINGIFKCGVIINIAVTLIVSSLAVCIPKTLLSMFINDPTALHIGANYLRIVGVGYLLFSVFCVSNGIMNGAGHTLTTMIISLAALWVVRVPLSAFLIHTKLGLSGIWISITLSFATNMVISLVLYFSGRWKVSVVNKRDKHINVNETEQGTVLTEET